MTEVKEIPRTLAELIKLTPGFKWTFYNLSDNPALTLDDIKSFINPEKGNTVAPFVKFYEPGNLYGLSSNPNMTVQFVRDYPDTKEELEEDLGWYWDLLTNTININEILLNKDLPWNWNDIYNLVRYNHIDVVKELANYKWDMKILSKHINITDILNNLDYKWDWEAVSLNKTVTYNDVKSHPKIPWNWTRLSTVININDIINNPDEKWVFRKEEKGNVITYRYGIAYNKTVTTEYILKNINLNWNWYLVPHDIKLDYELMLKSDIDWSQPQYRELFDSSLWYADETILHFLLKYIDIFMLESSYTWSRFYERGVITLQNISDYPELIYDYKTLSSFVNLKGWYISAYSEEAWDWRLIYTNDGLHITDFEEIKKSIPNHVPDYYALSSSPNLTYEYIYSHLYASWDTRSLERNPFTYEASRRKIVDRLQNSYLKRKNKRLNKFLIKSGVIKDLSNIIIEY